MTDSRRLGARIDELLMLDFVAPVQDSTLFFIGNLCTVSTGWYCGRSSPGTLISGEGLLP